MVLYQGDNKVLSEPKIITDGFYCKNFEKQTERWTLTKKE